MYHGLTHSTIVRIWNFEMTSICLTYNGICKFCVRQMTTVPGTKCGKGSNW